MFHTDSRLASTLRGAEKETKLAKVIEDHDRVTTKLAQKEIQVQDFSKEIKRCMDEHKQDIKSNKNKLKVSPENSLKRLCVQHSFVRSIYTKLRSIILEISFKRKDKYT